MIMRLKSLECNITFCLEEIDQNPPDLSKLYEAWSENYDIDYTVYFNTVHRKIFLEIKAFRNTGRSWIKDNWLVFAKTLEKGEIPEILESDIERILGGI